MIKVKPLIQSLDTFRNSYIPKLSFYVISHERSGTHFLINSINSNLNVRVGYGIGKGSGRGYNNIGENFGPYDSKNDGCEHINHYNLKLWHKGVSKNAIIKSHATTSLYKKNYKKAPVVYIYRNPIDCLASWYKYLNNATYYNNNPLVQDMRCINPSEFLRRPCNSFLNNCYSDNIKFNNVVERWINHVSGWTKETNICLVKYSELKADYEAVLESVSEYLNVSKKIYTKKISINKSRSILPGKGIIGGGFDVFNENDRKYIIGKVCDAGLSHTLNN